MQLQTDLQAQQTESAKTRKPFVFVFVPINNKHFSFSVFQPLDFESKHFYNLTVVATNIRADSITGGPYMDQATIKIVVEDSDEPPVFTKSTYLFDVHENAAINTVIGAVVATDQDAPHSQVR